MRLQSKRNKSTSLVYNFVALKVSWFWNSFWGHRFPPKNKQMNSTLLYYDTSGWLVFIHWRKSTTPKKHFGINWSLEAQKDSKDNFILTKMNACNFKEDFNQLCAAIRCILFLRLLVVISFELWWLAGFKAIRITSCMLRAQAHSVKFVMNSISSLCWQVLLCHSE